MYSAGVVCVSSCEYSFLISLKGSSLDIVITMHHIFQALGTLILVVTCVFKLDSAKTLLQKEGLEDFPP